MRVDFYILPGTDMHKRQHFACKLVEKVWQQTPRIVIQTDNATDSAALDDLLWTFSDGSFIPHTVRGGDSDAQQPVLISHDGSMDTCDLLINLSSRLPDVPECKRVAEIINQDEPCKLAGRERFKQYRAQQCDLHHHEMNDA